MMKTLFLNHRITLLLGLMKVCVDDPNINSNMRFHITPFLYLRIDGVKMQIGI